MVISADNFAVLLRNFWNSIGNLIIIHKINRIYSERHSLNIGILRMTGEMTDRFNEITLFGMVLFWQKAIEFFTKLLQN